MSRIDVALRGCEVLNRRYFKGEIAGIEFDKFDAKTGKGYVYIRYYSEVKGFVTTKRRFHCQCNTKQVKLHDRQITLV